MAETSWTPIGLLRQLISWWRTRLSFLKRNPSTASNSPLSVYALPADYGDAILLEFLGTDEKSHFIWVDGGLVRSYEEHLKPLLQTFPEQEASIDLMVISHIDQDHIGGILGMAGDEEFKKDFIQQFWFNSGQMLAAHFGSPATENRSTNLRASAANRSIRQGDKLETWLSLHGGWFNHLIHAGQQFELYGANIAVLSPGQAELQALHLHWQTEMHTNRNLAEPQHDYDHSIQALSELPEVEDDAIPNGSSIAFLIEVRGKIGMLLGDAHPQVIVNSLRQLGYSAKQPLLLNWVKLSHHGSKYSLSKELLEMIRCQHYLISTIKTGDPNYEFSLLHIKAGGEIPAHDHHGSEM
ncbi:MAG: hypothetical protein AAF399_28030, partial [Bacteroidota bacterium]